MQLTQKFEFRKLLAPTLTQSLRILAMPLLDLRPVIDAELAENPFLEEKLAPPLVAWEKHNFSGNASRQINHEFDDVDPFASVSKNVSLQDILNQQLELSSLTGRELEIGREIIGSLDENGYLKVFPQEIAAAAHTPVSTVHNVIDVIRKFEPAGVGAASLEECLLIQSRLAYPGNILLEQLITNHLADIAKKKYEHLAKELSCKVADIEACVRKLTCLDPKPGRGYSVEASFHVLPDIIIEQRSSELDIILNRETIPVLKINEEYRAILKKGNIPEETRAFLREKLKSALELMRALSKRHSTVRRVIAAIAETQKEALVSGLEHLKPLTFKDIAHKTGLHESTVCRVVMNKYAETPQGLIEVRRLFTNAVKQNDGGEISSAFCKNFIREQIESEDKGHPLSDEDLSGILMRKNGIKLARRTVAKYREELKFLSSSLRRCR